MQSTRFKCPYSNLRAVSRPLEPLNEVLTRRSRKRKTSIKKMKGSIKKKKKMSIDAFSVLDDEDVEESDEEDYGESESEDGWWLETEGRRGSSSCWRRRKRI